MSNDRKDEDEQSFEKLLLKAKSGNPEDVGIFLAQYRPYLLLIANQDLDKSITGKLGPSDVVQESMMAAHQQFGTFRGETKGELLGWLRTILVNDIRSARRNFRGTQKRQIDLERSIDAEPTHGQALVDHQLTPRSTAIQEEEARLLRESLARLSEDHRQVLDLHDWQQKSFVEIGEIMGRSPDATRKLWTRAIIKLQEIMAEKI